MHMDSPLVVPLVGLVYLLGFGALSFVRRQGLSARFAIEGLIVTAVGTGLRYAGVWFHPLLFLIVLYLITMRVRLLVDVGNWFSARGQGARAMALYRLALQLGPDVSSRQIVLINQGVAYLRNKDPELAYNTLCAALADEDGQIGAQHLAATYYNLGLACRRTGREAEAVRRFNEAIDAWPESIFGQAATRELEKGGKKAGADPE
jgi:tetratricopeptide (TPR) repeat protein